jgi:hypothetical protein
MLSGTPIQNNMFEYFTMVEFLGSQKGKSEKGESKKAIAFLVRPVAFLAVAFLFFGL